MKREFLKSLELTDEVIDKIMAEHGNAINTSKAKIAELESQIAEQKTQIADREKQLETLKKSAGDNENLKEQIGKLQEENKAATEAYEAKIKQMGIDSAVALALTNAKAKNAKAVRALLDLENAQLDSDGAIKGLDKQISKLKESDSYLFDGAVPPAVNGAKPAESAKTTQTKAVKDMTYSEMKAHVAAGGTLD
ncbi:MAG: phage scaffolding protein [Elusimicrobiaceae bacterium]|nr:phage scaffolding protein [Elusimicrobiaceae bacterium]